MDIPVIISMILNLSLRKLRMSKLVYSQLITVVRRHDVKVRFLDDS